MPSIEMIAQDHSSFKFNGVLYYIGETMTVIGDKLFIYRRNKVKIVGPGYIRTIKNSWYKDINTDEL